MTHRSLAERGHERKRNAIAGSLVTVTPLKMGSYPNDATLALSGGPHFDSVRSQVQSR